MDCAVEQRHGRKLLELARQTLAHKLERTSPPPAVPDDPALSIRAATFVTLKMDGELRGCIGHLEPVGALWEGVRDNAVNAAFHDGRFRPLSVEELPQVQLDISILTPARPLEYTDVEELLSKLQPGLDGVILRHGRQRATFLPQVWQQLPSPDQFLGQLCIKAGLPRDYWRTTKLAIETYRVQCFHEERR